MCSSDLRERERESESERERERDREKRRTKRETYTLIHLYIDSTPLNIRRLNTAQLHIRHGRLQISSQDW